MAAIMGRPTDYSPAIIDKAKEYLAQFDNLDEDSNGKVPSHAGLSKYLGISREYMYQWAKQEGKEDFSYMLKMIKNTQEMMLLEGGLSSKYNPTITKLMLSKHGYHDNDDKNQGVTINVNVNRDSQEVVIEGKVIDTSDE